MRTRDTNILKNLDWWTVLLFGVMVLCGLVSIYAASYSYDSVGVFDLGTRAGKQMLWIGLAFIVGMLIMLVDTRLFETLARPAYLGMLLLLLITIVIAPDVKGSRSWLVLGPVSIQPAEFGKFTTSLMLAWLFNNYGFNLSKAKSLFQAMAVFVVPILLIIMQKETGTALVYMAMIIALYREGMSGLIMISGLCAILFFVLGVKYSETPLGTANLGIALVLFLISYINALMLRLHARNKNASWILLGILTVIATISCVINHFFPINFTWVGMLMAIIAGAYSVMLYLYNRFSKYFYIALFTFASIGFIFSVDYAFNNILQPHQKVRIEVSLGMKDDLRGAGYNVNQAKIAIGSGGLWGKGMLNGTQTKLKYVPEQDTDFIFCTIGEEEGFVGSVGVLLLFLIFILRLLFLAERQRSTFSRVYGYCVASIFMFHLMVNVGMVLGLVPVIGIPLPFFSYGGSSLWSFSILLFIFLRLDASRLEQY